MNAPFALSVVRLVCRTGLKHDIQSTPRECCDDTSCRCLIRLFVWRPRAVGPARGTVFNPTNAKVLRRYIENFQEDAREGHNEGNSAQG